MALENKGKKTKRSLEDLIKAACHSSLNIISSQGLNYDFDPRRGVVRTRRPDRPPIVRGNEVMFTNTDGERWDNILPYTKKAKISIEIED